MSMVDNLEDDVERLEEKLRQMSEVLTAFVGRPVVVEDGRFATVEVSFNWIKAGRALLDLPAEM